MLTSTVLICEFDFFNLIILTLTIESWSRSPALPLTISDNHATRDHEVLHSTVPSDRSDSEKYGSIKMLESWFPSINPEHPRSRTWRTWKARRQLILGSCFVAVFSICLINFSLAIWAWVRFGTTSDGVVELYQGDCAIIKQADSGAHIAINIFGTVLLGASNLTLQLLAAPTRKEVDAAHIKGIWLDIGVLSFRNLRHITRSRSILWVFLAMTSIPIIFL